MNPTDGESLFNFSNLTPTYLFGAILFSVVGFVAFRFGKKTGRFKTMILGLILMVYSYFTPTTWSMYLVGAAICGAIYWFRHE